MAAGSALSEVGPRFPLSTACLEFMPELRLRKAICVLTQKMQQSLFDDMENWLHTQLSRISDKSPLARAIRYALTRLPKAQSYLDNGHLEMNNNAAERAMKPIALGRKIISSWDHKAGKGCCNRLHTHTNCQAQ
ncbi:transposase [Pseudovibrio sp. Tun.PSC04-5.I4]|uniref:IS66 family transposase n=1 Tax=Pseudovibrio sp. Tun.PSC04-5.I4 TaxID=1798213 RepID=UPI001AD936AB|nr:transposase [Pseudovibrio sp. Tun.PSC04-5.I4]